MLYFAIITIFREPDSGMDDDEWVCNQKGELVRQEKDSPYCPIKPCACCPEYILLSGG